MHLFTGVQLACFCVVALVKWIPSISIAFPLAISVAVAIRQKLLPHIFTDDELQAVSGRNCTFLFIFSSTVRMRKAARRPKRKATRSARHPRCADSATIPPMHTQVIQHDLCKPTATSFPSSSTHVSINTRMNIHMGEMDGCDSRCTTPQ